MEVILLERIGKLGQMGDVVRVKDGFARNFLLPKGKALRATEDNKARVRRHEGRARRRAISSCKGEAEKIAKKLDGKSFTVLRQASETGQLYGSVSPRDIAALLDRRRLRGRPHADRAQRADQDHRPAQGAGGAASGGRGDDHRQRRPQRRRGRAHRPRRGRHRAPHRREEEAAVAAAAAEALFEPEAQAIREREQARRSREAPAADAERSQAGQGGRRERTRPEADRESDFRLRPWPPAWRHPLSAQPALTSVALRLGGLGVAGLGAGWAWTRPGLASPAWARQACRRRALPRRTWRREAFGSPDLISLGPGLARLGLARFALVVALCRARLPAVSWRPAAAPCRPLNVCGDRCRASRLVV